MCYSRCPFENSYTGECQSPEKNSMSPSAHCHEREDEENNEEEGENMACGKSKHHQKAGDKEEPHWGHSCGECAHISDDECMKHCVDIGECYWEPMSEDEQG